VACLPQDRGAQQPAIESRSGLGTTRGLRSWVFLDKPLPENNVAHDASMSVSPALKERAKHILSALKDAGLSIVTAESCTAGMVAAVLSRAEGAGDVLHGGFVTYTKQHKTKALGVSAELLQERGAVNADVVKQMALGALEHSPARVSLAVSGVLGPEEDEDGNPVGLVYFCAAVKGNPPITAREEWGNRTPEELLQLTIARALDLIESAIKDSNAP
jgi:nicotinamide-nucleotide amidase